MVARAEAKYIRISPFKVRPVIGLIKGDKANQALIVLEMTKKRGAFYLAKVLKSAISNAKNKGYEADSLFISNVSANSGPVLKRYRAASFGRATVVRKRTSHILIELDSSQKLIEEPKAKESKVRPRKAKALKAKPAKAKAVKKAKRPKTKRVKTKKGTRK
ncbi:MAG: 50S ribosomal protein L22 [Candidatus Omnitrophota bacterium]|nr:MAG: 50S ribosomal protein L22 [Candidatus Omnitrophota bacterium]